MLYAERYVGRMHSLGARGGAYSTLADAQTELGRVFLGIVNCLDNGRKEPEHKGACVL